MQPPQTPAALFAVKAFRTAIFGTPAPKPPQPRFVRAVESEQRRIAPVEDKPKPDNTQPFPEPTKADKKRGDKPFVPRKRESKRPDKRSEEKEDPRPTRRQKLTFQDDAKSIFDAPGSGPFKVAAHNVNIFDSTSSKPAELPAHLAHGTPARPASPTKGILMTSGLAVRQRKAVTFDPATKADDVDSKNSRVRSGLPLDFPGKFPSPWTPKTGAPRPSGSLEETSLPIGSVPKKRGVQFEVTESSRIEDLLNESDDDHEMAILHDRDLTTDMSAPKSASGQYWKEHAEHLEGMALTKVDKLRERCGLAIDYAKRKDAYCVNLGEKLREYVDKNKLLKTEIKRLQGVSQFSSTPEGIALADAMHMLAEKEATISAYESQMARIQTLNEQYEARLKTFEDLLDNREDKITELSMTLFSGENAFDDKDSEQVKELKQKLRKARLEVKELGPLRIECRNFKSRISILEREKENLEAQLERMKSIGDESVANRPVAGRSSTETRVRARLDELEKDKCDLKAEMRNKAAEQSKERREAEKTLRAEIAEFRYKVMSEELDKKELVHETERLRGLVSSQERDLVRARKASDAVTGPEEEWQKKSRVTTQELRQAKEEIAALRQQLDKPTKKEDEAPLRLYQPSAQLQSEANERQQKSSAPPRKHGETVTSKGPGSSPSDDSAIDRSYDRKPSTASHASPRNHASPRKPASPLFDLDAVASRPHETTANPALFLSTHSKPAESQAVDFADSFVSQRRHHASPRPSVVNFEMTPPAARRRTFAVTKKSSKTDGMDPARRAAAERRIAERKAKRVAERMATKA